MANRRDEIVNTCCWPTARKRDTGRSLSLLLCKMQAGRSRPPACNADGWIGALVLWGLGQKTMLFARCRKFPAAERLNQKYYSETVVFHGSGFLRRLLEYYTYFSVSAFSTHFHAWRDVCASKCQNNVIHLCSRGVMFGKCAVPRENSVISCLLLAPWQKCVERAESWIYKRPPSGSQIAYTYGVLRLFSQNAAELKNENPLA